MQRILTWRRLKGRAGANNWRDSLEIVHDEFTATMRDMGMAVTGPTAYYGRLEGMT